MRLSFSRSLVLLMIFAAPGPLGAQCPKPSVPPTGFPVRVIADQLVTHSDNYKTLGDLYVPNVPTPPCGWPLVVRPADFNGTRKGNVLNTYFAARGFALWSYDVRGNGDAVRLNPPNVGFTSLGADEKMDFAEQIEFVRSTFPTLVRKDRVAVSGTEAPIGDSLTWIAAAWSGRTLTIAGRRTMQFPVIDVITPMNTPPDLVDAANPDGTMFFNTFLFIAFAPFPALPVRWDPAVQSLIQQAWLNQDFTGFRNWWNTAPDRAVLANLRTSTVPIGYFQETNTWFNNSLDGEDLIASMTPRAPGRIYKVRMAAASGGNVHENQFWNETRLRWWDRYLWGTPNGVDTEAINVSAVLPLDHAGLFDRNAVVPKRFDDQIPPGDVAWNKYFLTDQGTLEPRAPSGTYAPTQIVHAVTPSYDPLSYLMQSSIPEVLAKIPLSEREFVLPPLAAEVELADRVRVSLSVVPNHAQFQLSAMLVVRASGATEDVMLTSRGIGTLNGSPGVPTRLAFELPPTDSVLPKGTTIKVILRNHWLREYPVDRSLGAAPYFVDSNTAVRHGGGSGDASWIEVPFRKSVRVGLAYNNHIVYLNQPTNIQFTATGGVARAKQNFFLLLGLSGHTPGTPVPGGVLPLRFDAMTQLGLTLYGQPIFAQMRGTIDSWGYGFPGFALHSLAPLDPVLSGTRITFALWLTPDLATGSVSNPFDIELR